MKKQNLIIPMLFFVAFSERMLILYIIIYIIDKYSHKIGGEDRAKTLMRINRAKKVRNKILIFSWSICPKCPAVATLIISRSGQTIIYILAH